jgi:hypothetical protein
MVFSLNFLVTFSFKAINNLQARRSGKNPGGLRCHNPTLKNIINIKSYYLCVHCLSQIVIDPLPIVDSPLTIHQLSFTLRPKHKMSS